jgi:hypothetical protein
MQANKRVPQHSQYSLLMEASRLGAAPAECMTTFQFVIHRYVGCGKLDASRAFDAPGQRQPVNVFQQAVAARQDFARCDSAHERLTSIVVANFLLLHEVSRPELISFDEQAGQFSASSNRTSKEKSPARQRGIKYFN